MGDRDISATGTTKSRVQLTAHNLWDPEEGLEEVVAFGVPDVLAVGVPDVLAVDVPDVPLVVEDGVRAFAGVAPFACAVTVVFTLIGAEELTARLARKTFKALNSCPRPVFSSYLLFVQCVPHVVPLGPPEHCLAAPSAEL